MSKNFSIKISDFTGIFKAIAEKANINGGETLEGMEISIFNETRKTIDNNKSIFTFNNKTYDAEGNELTYYKDYSKPFYKNNNNLNFVEYTETVKKNEKALEAVDAYVREQERSEKLHEEAVNNISNSWAKTFRIADKYKFKKFVHKVYEAAKELNISITNDGTTKETFVPSEKYPTIEDRIVDEMCGAFAKESEFKPTAVSQDGLYYGIFQFSQVGINDLIQHNYLPSKNLTPIPGNKIQNFVKLSNVEQLEYMVAYVLDCKKYFSGIDGQPIAPKQMYAMWHYPGEANKKSNCDDKAQRINVRLKMRDSISPID